eukprot:218475_1
MSTEIDSKKNVTSTEVVDPIIKNNNPQPLLSKLTHFYMIKPNCVIKYKVHKGKAQIEKITIADTSNLGHILHKFKASSSVFCKNLQRHGYCQFGDKCWFSHDQPICRNYRDKGWCSWGDKCWYRHE